MTTSARLLPLLFLALPVAACAAPAPAQDLAVQARGSAAVAPASTPDPAVNSPTPAGVEPVAAPASPAASQPAPAPANPAALETTVGGGAANRAAPPVAPVAMAPGSATGSLLQTLFALIVVLGVLGALAWFLKRYGPKAMGGTARLRVVGSLSLGGRERLLVVEIGNQWVVVGASPGRVNALATMPKQDPLPDPAAPADSGAGLAPHAQPAPSFADWLKQTIEKRK